MGEVPPVVVRVIVGWRVQGAADVREEAGQLRQTIFV